jgi:retinol dehydrogenase-12
MKIKNYKAMKTILITGATGSIGRAVATEFAKEKSCRLVLIGRNEQKLKEVKTSLHKMPETVDIVAVDLGDYNSIKKGVEWIRAKYPQIDALVNIAAVYKGKRQTNQKGIEAMFATNHLGPFQLTTGLMDVIRNTPGSVVLTVSAPSSTKLNFEDLNGEKKFSAFGAFGASKMANLLFSFRLAKEFEKGSQSAIAFHPGLVKSELLSEAPAILSGLLKVVSSKPESAAKTICELVKKQDHQLNGKFFTKGLKELKANAYAYEGSNQDRLWERSVALLN